MLILAVDTSCYIASAAVVRDGECVCEQFASTEQKHAETVVPLIESTLAAAGAGMGDVDLFAADVGPGSFTGVRIGVSTVNAMAFACGRLVVPVDALRTLYEPYADTLERVLAIIDAGNGNAYAAQYCAGETLVAPEAVVTADCLAALPEGTRIIGDLSEQKAYPCARQVGLAAYKLAQTAVQDAKPMYLRPSQAERMWKARQEAKRDGR